MGTIPRLESFTAVLDASIGPTTLSDLSVLQYYYFYVRLYQCEAQSPMVWLVTTLSTRGLYTEPHDSERQRYPLIPKRARYLLPTFGSGVPSVLVTNKLTT